MGTILGILSGFSVGLGSEELVGDHSLGETTFWNLNQSEIMVSLLGLRSPRS